MSEATSEQVEERPARERPGAVERFAQGFSAPAVLLALVAGGVTGWATRPPLATAPGPGHAGTPDTPDTPVAPDPLEPLEPVGPDQPPPDAGAPSRAEVEALIARGQLRQARDAAREAGFPDLDERATLLLAFTENVVPGAWGQADAALSVTLADGRTALGVLQREAGQTLELEAWDGEKLELLKPDVKGRKVLRGSDKARALSEALAQARQALGQKPSGLSVHRLAFLALRGGDTESGTRLLVEALSSNEGRILVDMFGSGDFALLHRARDALLGGSSAPPPVAPPPPRPDPGPDPDLDPDLDPEPVRPPPPPAHGDPLERDADWRRVETQYREGLALFRQAFGASVQTGTPLVKGALKRFQQAQELLERLLDRYPDEPRVEQRMMELNTLVLDCNKRLGTD